MNKRKGQRFLKNNFIEVQWRSNGVDSNGVAVNLSRKGIDLCCLHPPEVGAAIEITFQFEDERRESVLESIQGKVKWVRRLGLPHSGVEFASEVSEKRHPGLLSLIERAEPLED